VGKANMLKTIVLIQLLEIELVFYMLQFKLKLMTHTGIKYNHSFY